MKTKTSLQAAMLYSPQAQKEIEELRAEVVHLTELNSTLADQLTETIADNQQMGKIFDADDQLATAVAENRQLTSLAEVLQSRVFGLMDERNEFIRRIKGWEKYTKHLEKEIKAYKLAQAPELSNRTVQLRQRDKGS